MNYEHIWYYHPIKNSIQSLRYALRSDSVTHVIVNVGGILTENFFIHEPIRNKIRLAINFIRRYHKIPIVSRILFPTGYGTELESEDDIFDPSFYINAIVSLRYVAEQLGVSRTALDLEAYDYSPVRRYIQWESDYRFTDEDNEELAAVLLKVLERVDLVNYVFPAGSIREGHPYNQLSILGVKKICEHTYYNCEECADADWQYDYYGMYINTTASNPDNPSRPYYRTEEAREVMKTRSTFLYPKENNALAVAKALF